VNELYAYGFFGVLIAVSLLECVVPRRKPGDTLRSRWFGNVSLYLFNTAFLGLLFPVARFAWAVLCHEHGWGLFNNTAIPQWIAVAITLLVLDAVLYAQHYVLHHVPLLWRIHRTHHTDHDYDFTTGFRFHPFEAALSTTVALGAIAALGAPPVGVALSQLLSTMVTILEHGNLRLPEMLDRGLRLLVVTPDMHRIHHSSVVAETNSNFGTIFTWWDRACGTYVDQPAGGQEQVSCGLTEFSERKHLTVHWMLAQPFLNADPSRTAQAELAQRSQSAPV
jgi:sterol desaturase/sphingolipid hydroxylase (fatty acid hydroxylase superfamily)